MILFSVTSSGRTWYLVHVNRLYGSFLSIMELNLRASEIRACPHLTVYICAEENHEKESSERKLDKYTAS